MADEQLYLRPTEIGGQRYDDDFQVIWDGIPIGRILKQPGVPHGRPNWSWGVIFHGQPQQSWHRGIGADIDECKLRFKMVWSSIRPTLTEADIAEAREISRRGAERWNPKFDR